MKFIEGFSHFSREQKIAWVIKNGLANSKNQENLLKSYWQRDSNLENLHSKFSENTLSHFYLPFSIAPNFLINHKWHALPMVSEESSVVAAACKAAKFFSKRGGFFYSVKGIKKPGHVHFKMKVSKKKLNHFFFYYLKAKLLEYSEPIVAKMKSRGGGILEIKLKNKEELIPNYFQLEGLFDTCEAMGANFINSVLENFASTLEKEILLSKIFSPDEKESLSIIMSILSNYTPDCLVRAQVECHKEKFEGFGKLSSEKFIHKFMDAIQIANLDISRAVTHNKGILNGVDALVIATGNDFRAVEAACHAYALQEKQYKSLSKVEFKNNIFKFWVDLPLSLGTIGGLTSIHPLAKLSLEILGNPSSKELMGIIAVAGLAQNFGAISSLITTGIQKGHMKMHFENILTQMDANEKEKISLHEFFKNKTITYDQVVNKLKELRRKIDS